MHLERDSETAPTNATNLPDWTLRNSFPMSKPSARASDLAPPSSSSAPSGIRGAIDALVPSALVELFAAYDVAVAPLPRLNQLRLPPVPEVSAAVGFTLRGRFGPPGRVTLSLPGSLLEAMRNGGNSLKGDWTRELASQLIGRVKNRLLQFSVRMDVGVSSTIDSKALSSHVAQATKARVYAGRTLRGEMLVTLEGMPNEAELVYVGPVHVATEGSAILF